MSEISFIPEQSKYQLTKEEQLLLDALIKKITLMLTSNQDSNQVRAWWERQSISREEYFKRNFGLDKFFEVNFQLEELKKIIYLEKEKDYFSLAKNLAEKGICHQTIFNNTLNSVLLPRVSYEA